MADENPKVGDDDPAFDAADELQAQHQDWSQLDDLAGQMADVGDDKAKAKDLYRRLAGS